MVQKYFIISAMAQKKINCLLWCKNSKLKISRELHMFNVVPNFFNELHMYSTYSGRHYCQQALIIMS